MAEYASLSAGDPAPWFHQRSGGNPNYAFDVIAGRYIVLCFYATARDAQSRAAVDAAFARPDIFDDIKASFFGVSLDQGDEAEKRIAERLPGYRIFWDFDGKVSAAYGVIPLNAQDALGEVIAQRRWVIIDPTLRIIDVIPFENDARDIAEVMRRLDALPPPSHFPGFEVSAPVLILPNVFPPEFCNELVGLYQASGGAMSILPIKPSSAAPRRISTAGSRRK
jgi:peroxiredoxin